MARKAAGPASEPRTNASTAATTRSRTGCLTCRKRKLKCDEARPMCANCQKGRRDCVPAETITFRNQQNPSLNHGSEENGAGLSNFYGYKDKFQPDHVWLPVPDEIRFVHITNPYAPDPEGETADAGPGYQQMATHTLEALSTAATQDSNAQFPLPYPSTSYADNNAMFAHYSSTHTTYPPYAARADTSNALSSAMIDPNLEASPSIEQQDNANLPTGSPELSLPFQFKMDASHLGQPDDQVAGLQRQFSEGPAPWMDLFDFNNYFTFQVPLRSAHSLIIKYAVLALAAKHTALHSNASSTTSSDIARTFFPTTSDANSLKYESLANFFHARALDCIRADRKPTAGVTTNSTSLEILTSAALLGFLSLLDNDQIATKKVWDTPMAERLVLQALTEGSSDETRSVFFELARYDCLSAFINERHAVLDTENISLWQSVGLQIDPDTGILNNNNDNDSSGPRATTRHSCNALFWILTKIVNFIADGDRVIFDPSQVLDVDSPIGVSQQTLLGKWHQLKDELELWHKRLPNPFTPAARITPAEATPRMRAFTEIWYHIPTCASAMQFYHMACIVLLINKPHETTARRSTIAIRLKSYASITNEIRIHAREICGISASKPKNAVRVYSVQPLFIAGQCLETALERKSVLNMLKGIQTDTGFVTEHRVNKLKHEWGWE